MDFDLDDPLDDILKSDNSTDSFFGNKNKKSVESSGKAISNTKDDKTRMSDLFGITSTVPEPPRPNTTPPVISKPITEPPRPVSKPERVLKKKEVSFDAPDDDDSITDLGFDPKKAKAKTNLFDDLLTSTATKKEPVKSPGTRPKTAAVSENATASVSLPPRPNTASRNSPKKSVTDPLGLFSNDKKKENELVKQDSKENVKGGSNFDWLGLDSKKAEENTVNYVPKGGTVVNTVPQPPATVPEPVKSSSNIPLSNEVVLLDALQRQESQLTVAMQMKQQETVLVEMQHRQQMLLQQQETKFQELLQNQINRQTRLEGAIRSQQNRINNHLENLMNQPVDIPVQMVSETVADPVMISQSKSQMETPTRDIELIELQNEVKRLELEKLRVEDLFSNTTANHEQEVAYLEQSHKKQIQLLEDQMGQVENRLKQDNKTLDEFYRQKLELLETDKKEVIEKYEKKLRTLNEEHESTLINLKSHHTALMSELKEEHQRALGHLRDSKLMELSHTEDRFSYLDHLKTAAKYMETATGDIESLRVTINERIETLHKDKERELERREKRVEMEQRHLIVVQETAQNEQKRLLELVHSLEAKLNALSKEASDDQWIVRQKLVALEAERNSFEKEQFYFREQQKRDEKRLEEMRETILQEKTSIAEEINQERQKLTEEKVKLATLQKLNDTRGTTAHNNDHEVEIAIQVAKEAARQADVERDNWMARQRQCELKKREIVEYEQQIRRKETDVEVLLNAAREREQRAQNFVGNAKMVEQKVIAKYQQLTRNVQDLVERERKLSEEKQALSRERMDLQASQQATNSSKCGLCRVGVLSTTPGDRDQAENFNYNDLQVGLGLISGVDQMFSQELNDILKQVPQRMDH